VAQDVHPDAVGGSLLLLAVVLLVGEAALESFNALHRSVNEMLERLPTLLALRETSPLNRVLRLLIGTSTLLTENVLNLVLLLHGLRVSYHITINDLHSDDLGLLEAFIIASLIYSTSPANKQPHLYQKFSHYLFG
jgi:hypothetical protein